MTEWFRSLAEVPGLGYRGDPRARDTRLAGRNDKPRVVAYMIDGKRQESLQWETADGAISSSPATRHAGPFGAKVQDQSIDEQLQALAESLELPGTPTDYHFVIQYGVDELWKLRRRNLRFHPELERLCLLDLALVRARPSAIIFEHQGEQKFARVLAFHHLLELYSQNGLLREAIAVAQLERRLGQDVDGPIDMLEARWAQVKAEAE